MIDEIDKLVLSQQYAKRSHFIRAAIRNMLIQECDNCPYCKKLIFGDEPHFCQLDNECLINRLYSHLFVNSYEYSFTSRIHSYSAIKCSKCTTLKIQRINVNKEEL